MPILKPGWCIENGYTGEDQDAVEPFLKLVFKTVNSLFGPSCEDIIRMIFESCDNEFLGLVLFICGKIHGNKASRTKYGAQPGLSCHERKFLTLLGSRKSPNASENSVDSDFADYKSKAGDKTATPAPATGAKATTTTPAPAGGAKVPTDADLLATIKELLNGYTTQAKPLKVANLKHPTFKAVIGPDLRFGKNGGMTKMIAKVVFGVDKFRSLTDGIHVNGVHAVIQANGNGTNQHLSLWRDP